MLTQQAFLITNEKGQFLRENTSNSTVWSEHMDGAHPCLTYVEAEMMIDKINLKGFYQIQKVFARVPE